MGDQKLEQQKENNEESDSFPEFNEEDRLAALKKAKAIETKSLEFVANSVSRNTLAKALIQSIPFLAKFLRQVDVTGTSLSKFAELNQQPAAEAVGAGFQIAGIAILGLDFFRIPIMYLMARILGVDLPFTLSKGARFIYAGFLLILGIVALTVPVAATPIALLTASLGLGASIFLLGKYIYERYKTKKDLKRIELEITQAKEALMELQHEAEILANELEDPAKKSEYPDIAKQIEDLEERYKKQEKLTQDLYDEQAKQREKLAALGWGKAIDRITAIGLASVAFLGVTLSLFFPPVGLGLILASAGAGVLYFIARVSYPLVKKLITNLMTDKPSGKVTQSENYESLRASSKLYSTSFTVLMLFSQKKIKAVDALHTHIDASQYIEHIENKLSSFVASNNLKDIAGFFRDVAKHAETHHLNEGDIETFFAHFPSMCNVLPLLKVAMESFTVEEKEQLVAYKPLRKVLRSEGVLTEFHRDRLRITVGATGRLSPEAKPKEDSSTEEEESKFKQ